MESVLIVNGNNVTSTFDENFCMSGKVLHTLFNACNKLNSEVKKKYEKSKNKHWLSVHKGKIVWIFPCIPLDKSENLQRKKKLYENMCTEAKYNAEVQSTHIYEFFNITKNEGKRKSIQRKKNVHIFILNNFLGALVFPLFIHRIYDKV